MNSGGNNVAAKFVSRRLRAEDSFDSFAFDPKSPRTTASVASKCLFSNATLHYVTHPHVGICKNSNLHHNIMWENGFFNTRSKTPFLHPTVGHTHESRVFRQNVASSGHGPLFGQLGHGRLGPPGSFNYRGSAIFCEDCFSAGGRISSLKLIQ